MGGIGIRSSAIIEELAGKSVVLVFVRTPTGRLFIRYHPWSNEAFARQVKDGESAIEQVGTLIPEFLLGILVGKAG